MKPTRSFLTAVIVLALSDTVARAGLSYWDSNGPAPGAGDTPTGV
jgi:hypothetical protein